MSDPDQVGNGNFTVELSNDSGVFAINQIDGDSFILKLAAELDRESTDRYNITVTAWDNGTPPLSVSTFTCKSRAGFTYFIETTSVVSKT